LSSASAGWVGPADQDRYGALLVEVVRGGHQRFGAVVVCSAIVDELLVADLDDGHATIEDRIQMGT
jgi:hypothetical protein